MKFKTNLVSIIFIIFITTGCKIYNITKDNKIENSVVFRIEYKSKNHIGFVSTTYAILDINRLDSFTYVNNVENNSPNILYNITYNGGFYISEQFIDIYTLGCCEYENIEKGLDYYFKKNINSNTLEDYSKTESINMKLFNNKKGLNYLFKENNANYKITVWSSNLKYCVCERYMESPHQAVFGINAAYIKRIESINKPEKRYEKKITTILMNLMKLDTRN